MENENDVETVDTRPDYFGCQGCDKNLNVKNEITGEYEPDGLCLTAGPCQVYGDFYENENEPAEVTAAAEVEPVQPQITAASNGRLF